MDNDLIYNERWMHPANREDKRNEKWEMGIYILRLTDQTYEGYPGKAIDLD